MAQTATIHMNASSTTPRTKYLITSIGPPGNTACQACAPCAVTYWNIPDSTGYSMYRTSPESVTHEYLYGNAPWLRPSAEYSGSGSA